MDREFNYGWKTRLLANLTKREYQLSSQAKLDDEEILNVNARLDDQQNQAEISADFVTRLKRSVLDLQKSKLAFLSKLGELEGNHELKAT